MGENDEMSWTKRRDRKTGGASRSTHRARRDETRNGTGDETGDETIRRGEGRDATGNGSMI